MGKLSARAGRAAVLLVAVHALRAGAVAAQDESFRTDTLAPGVWALIRPVRPDLVAISNHLVIEDEEGVTLVDAGLTPGIAQGVLAAIRQLSAKPVRTVIDTHWHDDHVWGNQVFRDSFPEVEIVAHPFTDRYLRDSLEVALLRNREAYADALARYERALRTGRTSRGDTVTAEMRSAFEGQQAMLAWFTPQMDGMRVAPPTLLVDGRLVLRRPGREIHVLFLGRGNTGGDLVVHLPAERIVASGDLVVAPVPYAFGSYLGEWTATLDRLKALGPDVLVPGHGEPQRDFAYVERVQELIARTLERVRGASGDLPELSDVRARVDLADWRAHFTGGDPVLERGFDAYWVEPAVERAWLEVSGRLPPPPTSGADVLEVGR